MENPFSNIERLSSELNAQAAPPVPQQTYVPPASNATLPEPPRKSSKKWLWLAGGALVLAGLGAGGYFAYSKGYLPIPFLTPKNDSLFDKMIDSTSEIKNAQYSARVNLKSEIRSDKATPIFTKKKTSAINPPHGTDVGIGETTSVQLTATPFSVEDVGSEIGLGQADLGSSYLGALLGLAQFDELFRTIPGDINFGGGVTIYLEADKEIKDADGFVRIDGTYRGGDISVDADLEARKVGKDVFGIIRKFPSFFFIDTSAIKEKWVRLNGENGDGWIEDSVYDEFDSKRVVETLKLSLKNALKYKVFAVEKHLPSEVIAGVNSEHYAITISTEKLPDLYNALIEEKQAKGEGVKDLERIRDELKKQEVSDVLKRIADNSTFEIWVDKVRGYLRQTTWALTIVPPEGNERLKDKQFLLELTLTLERVNDKVSVSSPNESIDIDEATRLLTGITKEEQMFEKQTSRIRSIQSALRQYHSLKKSYPEGIADLGSQLKKATEECLENEKPEREAFERNRNANVAAEPKKFHLEFISKCGYIGLDRPAKNIVVVDVYSKQPYGYSRDGDDLKLTYEIRYFDGMSSYDKETYAEGINTATSKDESLEKTSKYEEQRDDLEKQRQQNQQAEDENAKAQENKDSDQDGLSTMQESLYKTSGASTDTDGDGYSDGAEVRNGYNPAGPGKLNVGPTISDIRTQLKPTNVEVTWKCSSACDGWLFSGLTSSYGTSGGEPTKYLIDHKRYISVKPGRTYHYAIRSCDQTGACSFSTDQTVVAP